MAETYEIFYAGERAGTVQREKQGLYYLFSCRCRLPEEGLYRIHVICGERWEDLGICVPLDGAFGMDKKIPAKRLGEGDMTFELLPKDWQLPAPEPVIEEQAVPMVEEQPEPSEEAEYEEELFVPEPEEDVAEPAAELFVPVAEEAPFDYLDHLEDAVLAEKDGRIGIVIPEPETFQEE